MNQGFSILQFTTVIDPFCLDFVGSFFIKGKERKVENLLFTLFRPGCKVCAQVRKGQTKRPEAIGFVLIFWFFSIKGKERKEELKTRLNIFMPIKEASFHVANLTVAAVTFFLLEQKEPKIQECRIASGRHSTQRSWVATLQASFLSANRLF